MKKNTPNELPDTELELHDWNTKVDTDVDEEEEEEERNVTSGRNGSRNM